MKKTVENKKGHIIRQMLLTTFWIATASATLVLLIAAIHKKDAKICKGVEINIKGASNNLFVDNADVMRSITLIAHSNPVGKTTGTFELGSMETELRKNIWIKGAELFFDNNEVLQVKIYEREPIARIFTTAGTSFYIDREIDMIPLSEKFSARLPVFTDFPMKGPTINRSDSDLLEQIKILSLQIQKDSFQMAMIEQVDITPRRIFEMIPKIGKQIIVFGDATNAEEKFRKLELFYKQVMARAGWDYYNKIDLQYKDQVVAQKQDVADIRADSIRTLQLMRIIAANAEKQANDTLQFIQPETEHPVPDSILIQQSRERDDLLQQDNTISYEKKDNSAAVDKSNVIPDETLLQRIVHKDPARGIKKPKAMMPKKNSH